ncbi:hypothetical protein SGL43_03330 [Streptomyces globisporus]|uniref:Uncharacterized protein n=1 Tax=Streptomyces globisporus TaxID=1908 RepID=A0ABM9GYE6_STRGL|nr:hypothetical protein SGL43_03330 [Streptomyces globisporus]
MFTVARCSTTSGGAVSRWASSTASRSYRFAEAAGASTAARRFTNRR